MTHDPFIVGAPKDSCGYSHNTIVVALSLSFLVIGHVTTVSVTYWMDPDW